jgi:hypothetical protein
MLIYLVFSAQGSFCLDNTGAEVFHNKNLPLPSAATVQERVSSLMTILMGPIHSPHATYTTYTHYSHHTTDPYPTATQESLSILSGAPGNYFGFYPY